MAAIAIFEKKFNNTSLINYKRIIIAEVYFYVKIAPQNIYFDVQIIFLSFFQNGGGDHFLEVRMVTYLKKNSHSITCFVPEIVDSL